MTHNTSDSKPRAASGSELYKLVTHYRRNGHTASFGVDKDPKLQRK